ncbi:hypothetical protein AZI86_18305 [Bdellovibrio bacteriovorus]|uniref:Uncharacterized protein n=1 Tax=Bdellovibrio bacteriovorus TaxID=959 RepID=A0A150WFS2_BDEBC|nr:hypothetical protein [Bdellovibrio bacteriovorus]KYG61651.1 hypothetical protein AZI86_18305 [Bdellovibrio bacteriovorus]
MAVAAPSQGVAAACCGGGFAAPALIVGDDKAQFTSSFGFTDVVVDNVDTQGQWRARDEHQKVQTLRVEAATLIADRWQMGLALPIIQRTYAGESSSGVGDVATTLGYEYLPDWDYNPYRPKGLGYLQITLPTGKSRAESENGMDSRGQGFWAAGVGTLLTKSWLRWDGFVSFEAHRSFEKEFENSHMKGKLKPGYGSTFGGGWGYNTAAWRFGGSVLWSYEDAVMIEPAGYSDGSVERYATASLSASYIPNDEWTGTMTYVDQTVFGEPINTSLGRGVTLQMQRRWGR